MADDEVTGAEPEVIDAPVEGVEQAETVQADDAPDPIAALASELGWTPKEQFTGDPERWKPADQFIRDGRDIQKDTSRQLREMRATVDNMSRTSATILEQQLARQRQELESQLDTAVENGDAGQVRQVQERIAQVEQQRPRTVVQDPAGQSFVERHASWWNKDTEATNYAIQRADHYAQQGIVGERQTAAVERDMRGIFPEKFPAPAKQAPGVAKPAGRTATTSSRVKGLHDLPAEAQAVARDYKERLGIPVETYVANYFADQGAAR